MRDGEPHLRADVLVVGAGPGGLAAAKAAALAGASVTVVDAAPAVGGQIWRATAGVPAAPALALQAALRDNGVRMLTSTRVAWVLPGQVLLLDGPDGSVCLRWRRLVIATGARERLWPFPGWTLPGVFGAGGLQALTKGGWPVSGRRVVLAGTGPLLLAAAATLRAAEASVLAVCEEAGGAVLARFAPALLAHPAKARQALGLAAALVGVRVRAGWRLREAQGEGRLQRVVLERVAGEPRPQASDDEALVLECDMLGVGWGLCPQTELAQSLGCALAPRFGAPAIEVDADQRTTVPEVFAVGECTGVAGAQAAVLAGDIAGRAAAGTPPVARRGERRALARERRFAAAVAAAFAPPADWAVRVRDDTLVCRCEDVRWGAIRVHPDLRAAKLATRCGMGHCQGRLCHDALAAMTGAERLPNRPPLAPVDLGALLAIGEVDGVGPDDVPPTPSQEYAR